jgi:hypothetical protein
MLIALRAKPIVSFSFHFFSPCGLPQPFWLLDTVHAIKAAENDKGK